MTVATMSGSKSDPIPVGDEMDQSVSTSPPAASEQEFDLDEAIMKLAGPVIDRKGEPVFTEAAVAEMYKSIQFVLVRYQRHSKGLPRGIEEITGDKWDDLKLWLYGVCNLEDLNSKTNSKFLFNVKNVLTRIQSPELQFPTEYQQIAAALSENFVTEPEPEPEPAVSAPSSKRQRKASTSKASNSSGTLKATGEVKQVLPKKAHPSHQIFGHNGIMRGIWIRKIKATSYLVDPNFKKDFRVFGHNGLAVGSAWPMQLVALRDGAHGARIGGISGTTNDGCYSIMVSGAYSDIDQDKGDIIKYSAPGSLEADSIADRTNTGTSALLRSIETERPIRVLRSSGGHWEGRPRDGIRYDGLYIAESSMEVTKKNGGAFIQFRLRRRDGQAPIDRSRPNIEERRQFALVKAGF